MTEMKIEDESSLALALQRLAETDADVARGLEQAGLPPLRYRPPGFATLLRIIVAQQVSLAAAASIWVRLEATCQPLEPERLLALSDDDLRAAGLSRQKQGYARSLARLMDQGELDLPALEALEDEAAVAHITRVKGLGRWSAEVYLLFSHGRPDVWPADDVGLMIGMERLKQLPERPTVRQMRALAEDWRPYRAAGARLLWHYRQFDGQAAGRSDGLP